MKINVEVTKQTKQMVELDIEFPYYYEFDLCLDHCNAIIYGKIEELKHSTVKITQEPYKECEISVEFISARMLGEYLVPTGSIIKSDYETFRTAVKQAMDLLEEI